MNKGHALIMLLTCLLTGPIASAGRPLRPLCSTSQQQQQQQRAHVAPGAAAPTQQQRQPLPALPPAWAPWVPALHQAPAAPAPAPPPASPHQQQQQRQEAWARQQSEQRRQLRQYVGTHTGSSIDKDKLTVAATPWAEAVSNPKSYAMADNNATRIALASTRYPGAMSRASTQDTFMNEGAVELQVAAFGPVATAVTDTNVGAFSGSEAMRLAAPYSVAGTSRANTLAVLEPVNPLEKKPGHRHESEDTVGIGGGAHLTGTVGVNKPTIGAFAMSEIGDGPHAISHAGEAVAGAFSSKDADGPDEEGGTLTT